MAQPTQDFPPWLSPSAFIVTDAAGAPTATETTVVYVAPTYFGPSIPLGSLYSFGGTSEPPTVILPIPTPQTTTTIAPPSTTATPTITTSLTTIATPTTSVSSSSAITTSPTTSATPTTSLSAASSTIPSTTLVPSSSSSTNISSSTFTSSGPSSSSSFSATPSSTSTSSAGPAAMAGLTKGQLVGVIVASILGLIFLFVLALFLYLWCRGRRNRRNYNTFSQGIDDDYYFVPSGAGRVPGEGSPRHSGEEQDPFLQRSTAAGSSTAGGTSMGPGGAAAAGLAAGAIGAAAMTQVPSAHSASRPPVPRVQPPMATTGSNSSGSTGSHASGFGVLLDRPSLGVQLPSMAEREESGAGHSRPLSDVDMRRIGHESVLPEDYEQYPDEEYTGAYAYSQDPNVAPRLVGSAPLLSRDDEMPFASTPSPGRDLTHQPSLEESATLLTARRVKVEDLGPRISPNESPATAGPSDRHSGGFLGALGLGGLSRLSWFGRSTASRHSTSDSQDYTIEPFLEKDVETGRQGQMLSPADAERRVDSFGGRARGVGPDGIRPASGLSARSGTSGGTLYHDAESSVPGTPLLAAPPRAITPADAGHAHAHPAPLLSEHAWLAGGAARSPPGYEPPLGGPSGATSPMQSPTGTSFDHSLPADILDLPAPPALTHFASISSLKETPTGSSAGAYKPAPFPPPGLETIRPIGWADSVGANVSPRSAFDANLDMGMSGGAMDHEHGAGISIDILEEAPPDAEQGWRTMSAPAFPDVPNTGRGTFGTYVPAFGTITSEQGSLHSMRSHFTPSSRSTGSAAASRRDLNSSIGSAHSSSGQHSALSAVAHSLVRAGSISGDERRRAVSPALSALGYQPRHAHAHAHAVPADAPSAPAVSVGLPVPPSAHMPGADKTGSGPTLRSVGSESTTTTMLGDTSMSTVRPARSLSPLSATFPLNAPWAGGLDSEWQPSV